MKVSFLKVSASLLPSLSLTQAGLRMPPAPISRKAVPLGDNLREHLQETYTSAFCVEMPL